MSKGNYLRMRSTRHDGVEPRPYEAMNEYVARPESDETRRRNRDWLRDRDENNSMWFEDEQELV